MSGKILEAARRDARKMVSSMGFEEDIKLQTPNGGLLLELKGLHSKHWLKFDTDGNAINSKNAHVTIHESFLRENSYPVRNQNTGEIDLINHIVSVKDESSIEKHYVIIETMPSETLGIIICILGDYSS